jgi:hypothetical protein
VSHTCGGPRFGRLPEPGKCQRCDALRAGAAPVRWRGRDGEQLISDAANVIRKHDCKRSGCSSICCTFGDW